MIVPQTSYQYLGKSLDATNREVDIYRDGNDIIAEYKSSGHQGRMAISDIQAKTVEELLWTPFVAFKKEIDGMNGYDSQEEAVADINDYILSYYNRKRPHGHNGYLTPYDAEIQFFEQSLLKCA